MNGADVLLLANTGTEAVPSYEVVGSQRNVSFSETTANIDSSSKDSRAAGNEPGRYASSLSLEHLYVPTDEAYQALKDAMRDGEKILIRRQEEDSALEEANCVVNSISEAAPDQDVATVAIELTVDGVWTELTS